MNEETTKLLENLANKLGTTSEYLWSVLLKQAPIDATISLFQTAVIFFIGYLLYKKRSIVNSEYDERLPIFVAVAIVWSIVSFITIMCIGDIINGYFNPEYWALQRVMDMIGSK
jgi:hypothetical protein